MVKQVDYCGKLKNKPAMVIHHEPKFAIWIHLGGIKKRHTRRKGAILCFLI